VSTISRGNILSAIVIDSKVDGIVVAVVFADVVVVLIVDFCSAHSYGNDCYASDISNALVVLNNLWL